MYYTYILECINSKSNRKIYYVGFTDDLKSRVKQHKIRNTKTTKPFDRIELIYYEACLNKRDAIIREHQLKTGFGRGYIKRRLKNHLESQADVV